MKSCPKTQAPRKAPRLPELERVAPVLCSALLDCDCCGLQPAVVEYEDKGGGQAVECACGRRTSWYILATDACREWNDYFGLKQSNADIRRGPQT